MSRQGPAVTPGSAEVVPSLGPASYRGGVPRAGVSGVERTRVRSPDSRGARAREGAPDREILCGLNVPGRGGSLAARPINLAPGSPPRPGLAPGRAAKGDASTPLSRRAGLPAPCASGAAAPVARAGARGVGRTGTAGGGARRIRGSRDEAVAGQGGRVEALRRAAADPRRPPAPGPRTPRAPRAAPPGTAEDGQAAARAAAAVGVRPAAAEPRRRREPREGQEATAREA